MDPIALVLWFLAGLAIVVLAVGIRQLLRRQVRKASAHTEIRPAQGLKPARPQPEVAVQKPPLSASPPPPSRLIQAVMTYTKADGSTSARNLTIHSRNLKDGQTHSLNCRQQGERITKQFLLSGISRLELPGLAPPQVLTSSQAISDWLERVIPQRSSTASPSRPPAPPAPPAPIGAVPEAASNAIRPEALPAFPPSAPAPAPLQMPVEVSAPLALPDLLPEAARGFAVLDLETTGTGRSCRIVEIALVRLDPRGRITEEWETLVHPGMLIPNAHIHGIDDELVAGAPSFEEIVGILAAKLHEHVLVAHNLRGFDGPIPEAHFAEVDGIDLSLGSGVDTMPKPRVKLVDLCARHGVELDPGVAHTALGDTRALTRALPAGSSRASRQCRSRPTQWLAEAAGSNAHSGDGGGHQGTNRLDCGVNPAGTRTAVHHHWPRFDEG